MNGQSYNRYSYVLNNPTNLTDPTGFMTFGNCTGSVNSFSCDFGNFGSFDVGNGGGSKGGDGASSSAKQTTNSSGTSNANAKNKTAAEAAGNGEATIGPIRPTLAQKTIDAMKEQGGLGLIGAVLFEDMSKFLGTTGITTNQGTPYDYLANQFGCQSADCKSQAIASALSFGPGLVGRGALAAKEVGAAAKSTTVLGENMMERVIPFAQKTEARTLPFGTSAREWANMTPQARW